MKYIRIFGVVENKFLPSLIAGGNNNAGGLRSPQPPKANGGSEPPALRRFLDFSPKILIFKHTLVEISA